MPTLQSFMRLVIRATREISGHASSSPCSSMRAATGRSSKRIRCRKRSSRKNNETVWRLRRNGCVTDQLWFEISRKSQQKKHIEINEHESLKLKFIHLYPRDQRADLASWSSDSIVNSKRICRLRLFDLLAEI